MEFPMRGIPSTSKVAQLSVRSDHDRCFKIRAVQLGNLFPADNGKLQDWTIPIPGKPDTPPVTMYTPADDNSLLSWTSTRPLT